MLSTLLSPRYISEIPTSDDLQFSSIIWGVTLGIGALTAWKAAEQSITIWRHKKFGRSLYLWMVWLLWANNMAQSALTWFFVTGRIPENFVTYFLMTITWAVQTQLILQIILNRAALLIVDKRKALRTRWAVAIIILLVNISGFCIWLPARLRVSSEYVTVSKVWDRSEKCVFLVIDAGLNAYFLFLVKTHLIAEGLEKYKLLYRFNSVIVIVSVAMDVLLLVLMGFVQTTCYFQSHSLAYTVKLYIELVVTDMIVKVVRVSHESNYVTNTSEFLSSPDDSFRDGKSRLESNPPLLRSWTSTYSGGSKIPNPTESESLQPKIPGRCSGNDSTDAVT